MSQTETATIVEVHDKGSILCGHDTWGTYYIARPLRSKLNRNVCITDRISSARDWLDVKEVAA